MKCVNLYSTSVWVCVVNILHVNADCIIIYTCFTIYNNNIIL